MPKLLLPEMPPELLKWDEPRFVLAFPWNAPIQLQPWGPDKTPWSGKYRRRMEPLHSMTLRSPEHGAFGTLYVNLVVNENGARDDADKPNKHLNGYGDMYLFVHFEVSFPDDEPEDVIIDPNCSQDEDENWPKDECGDSVPCWDPRIPRWAGLWDDVLNGGFPIPEAMIVEVAEQLAYKRHKCFNPLEYEWRRIVDRLHNEMKRMLPDDRMDRLAVMYACMLRTFEHPDVDHAESAGGFLTGYKPVPVLLPRTVDGLAAMCDAFNDIIHEVSPDGEMTWRVTKKVLEGQRDLPSSDVPMSKMAARFAFILRQRQGLPIPELAHAVIPTPPAYDPSASFGANVRNALGSAARALGLNSTDLAAATAIAEAPAAAPAAAAPMNAAARRDARKKEAERARLASLLQLPGAAAAAVVFQKHWRARKARLRRRFLRLGLLSPQAIIFQKHWRGRKRRLAWPLEKLRRKKFFENLAESTRAQREAEFARRKQVLASRAHAKMLAERAEGNSHAHATIGNHGKQPGIDRSAKRTDDEQAAHEKWISDKERQRRVVEACAKQLEAAKAAATARDSEVAKAARALEIERGKWEAFREAPHPAPLELCAFLPPNQLGIPPPAARRSVPLSSVNAWSLPKGAAHRSADEDGASVVSAATTSKVPLPRPVPHAVVRGVQHGIQSLWVQDAFKNGDVEKQPNGRTKYRGKDATLITDNDDAVSITVWPTKAN